jgi:hypothetical protein
MIDRFRALPMARSACWPAALKVLAGLGVTDRARHPPRSTRTGYRRVGANRRQIANPPRNRAELTATARQQAAAFAGWAADPRNRIVRECDTRHLGKPVHPRLVNDELRAVAELFGFVAANPADARTVLGTGPWQHVTDAHAASWFRQVSRIPHTRDFNDEHYAPRTPKLRGIGSLPM